MLKVATARVARRTAKNIALYAEPDTDVLWQAENENKLGYITC